MPRHQPELTKSQIRQVRARLAKRVSAIGDRVSKQAMGELKNPQGEPIEMTKAQLDAARLIMSHILPAQQSVDVTETAEQGKTKEEHEQAYIQAMEQFKSSLKPSDIKQVLSSMDIETRQALIDSIEATSN